MLLPKYFQWDMNNLINETNFQHVETATKQMGQSHFVQCLNILLNVVVSNTMLILSFTKGGVVVKITNLCGTFLGGLPLSWCPGITDLPANMVCAQCPMMYWHYIQGVFSPHIQKLETDPELDKIFAKNE